MTGVALAVLVGGLLAPIVDNAAANAVIGHLGLRDEDLPFALVLLDLNFNALLFAALVLAIAEAFRRGGALADDVDGLV